MKATWLSILILCSSKFIFATEKACDYAGSNIGFVKTQTEKALEAEDINQSRYFTYKAINAIEKSRTQLEECGCEYAFDNIMEGQDNLKKATRTTSLQGMRILLNRALDNTLGGLEALEQHEELHQSAYASDVLAMNTKDAEESRLSSLQPQGKALQDKIDQFLEDYRESLKKVVHSVNCKEAYQYAIKVYEHCEQQLLKSELTEAKKYYNLKTKEITEEALEELKNCADR